jgi:hypothetical protein
MAGYDLLYFSVFRESDGYECVNSFSDGTDTVHDYIGYMKTRIDSELREDDPWGECGDHNWSI